LLGRSLVAWSSKKQNFVALSTAEAEYISAGACCAQILYMKQSFLDYGVVLVTYQKLGVKNLRKFKTFCLTWSATNFKLNC
jgi:hypothetical protein